MKSLAILMTTVVLTVVTIANILNIVYIPVSNTVLVMFWIASLLILIITILLKQFYKSKYKKENLENEKSPTLKENEYFYQAPVYLFDDMYIKLHGFTDTFWSLYFHNQFHKMLNACGMVWMHGLRVKSPENDILIRRIKVWSLRPYYAVFINNHKIGILTMKSIFKGGIKQQAPYIFKSSHDEYSFHNAYLSKQTTIQKDQHNILVGNRSFLDLKTNAITKRRGEVHDIKVFECFEYPKLLWIALYIQIMNNHQTKEN
ncbi:hypothetical protein DOS68_10560 [Staphylococcus felis]|uniref:hypothetical protein n=1 Tax=Staphylococcus felis TaxID=46127 RepID=UPI000E242695|nr:hypothetical protein [Staphylococcus felis]REH88508.1 hypothetical protein DOS68_10560 [Staphylococcus felis]